MTTTPDRKRRHHFVWQAYLSPWCTDGTIVCRRDGRVFSTGTRDVAVEKDFYEMKDLTQEEIAFIRRCCIGESDSVVNELNEGWLKIFTGASAIFTLQEYGAQVSSALARDIQLAKSNSQEDLHAAIEQIGAPYLEMLRSGDVSFLTSEGDRTSFLHFLCVQYFRTAQLRYKVSEALEGNPFARPEHIWDPMCHMHATSLAYSMAASWPTTRIELLRAGGSAQFITSDQPVVNLDALGQREGEAVQTLQFYWPITPSLALKWSPMHSNPGIQSLDVDSDVVLRLNCAMAALSHEWIFACSGNAIAELSAC